MMLADLHPCPRCECLVPREHNVRVVRRDHVYRALYCEFCQVGWEIEIWPNGDVYKLESSIVENPRHFQLFLDRLADAAFAETSAPPLPPGEGRGEGRPLRDLRVLRGSEINYAGARP